MTVAINLLRISGDMRLGLIVSNSDGASLRRTFGKGSLPAVDLSLSLGTGNNQIIWEYWSPARVLTATTTESFDLSGVLTDAFGTTINATRLKLAVVIIHSPDGTKNLLVGPQNVSGAAQLGWGGTGSTVYQTVYDWFVLHHPWGGWTITNSTADKFPVTNPTGSSITYSILLAGI